VSTFGDLAIAPSDPNVIWAGTGEQNNRQSTSWGNGVSWPTSGLWEPCGRQAASGACSARPTGARPGSTCCSWIRSPGWWIS
jgi:hypothetical protein